jgi:HEPN domain-containing protein
MIKQNFRVFTSVAWLIQRIESELREVKINDSACTSLQINLNVNNASSLLLAMPALTAFAVEMGLKFLLVKYEIDNKPHGHDLLKLFEKLPTQVQTEIINSTMNPIIDNEILELVHQTIPTNENSNEINKQITENFHRLLKECKNTFKRWRYFHEKKEHTAHTEYLQRLLLAIHNVSIDAKKNNK